MPTVARRFLVSGKVQGVFFRASTREVAETLGVAGHAINLPDGRVEVLAVGETSAVSRLGEWLWQGSPASRVDDVAAADVSAPDGITGFRTGSGG